MAILRSIWKVFCWPAYAVSAMILALATFLFLALLPNYRALIYVLDDGGLTLGLKISFLFYLILSTAESLSFFSIINTVVVSVLFGVNAVLIIYIWWRRSAGLNGKMAVSTLGGVGAGALSAVLSVFGAGGALALLPLRGGEFGILSAALLSVSIYTIARKINAQAVC